VIRSIRKGDRGEDVRAVQQGLNLALAGLRGPVAEDGTFWTETDSATRFFQQQSGLNPPDGVVGPITRNKLFRLKVLTTTVRGMRLRMPSLSAPRGISPPNLGPGPLVFPGLPGSQLPRGFNPNLLANVIRFADLGPPVLSFTPTKFPRLRLPLFSPPIALPAVPTLPPLPPILPPSVPQILPTPQPGLGFDTHHFELAPAGQATVGKGAQFAFTLALQTVVMIGDEDKAHREFTSGVQFQTPPAPDGGDWTIGFFAQITDVDRIGAAGKFHFWQPYAQVGVQQAGSFRPQVTGAFFPLNLTLDVSEIIGINVAGGVALTYDPNTGTVQAGAQMQSGVVVKLGQ
jgi:hypothetical protein